MTSLLGGTKVPKHHIRVEAYGTVDELNSFVGLLADQEGLGAISDYLRHLQDRLFVIGSQLAADPVKNKMQLPELSEQDVSSLEVRIDEMDEVLPPMKNFILPGGHMTVSFSHVCRSVCRRAERRVSWLAAEEEVNPLIVKYLNRMSDYLFTLSRLLTQRFGVAEIPWKPNS